MKNGNKERITSIFRRLKYNFERVKIEEKYDGGSRMQEDTQFKQYMNDTYEKELDRLNKKYRKS